MSKAQELSQTVDALISQIAFESWCGLVLAFIKIIPMSSTQCGTDFKFEEMKALLLVLEKGSAGTLIWGIGTERYQVRSVQP